MSRAIDPQMSFADVELLKQGIEVDPTLKAIAAVLDRQTCLAEGVRRDLQRGLKKPATGRHGLTAPQVLRSLILMRIKNWDYRELRERISDGLMLRYFTQFHSRRVPKHDAFSRAVNRLSPATLEAVNKAVIQRAIALGLEDGKKLRVDTTVVETDIHHPTDDRLLWDTVRVLSRLVGKLEKVVPVGLGSFRNRTRAARRRMLEIERMAARERHTQQVPIYRALIRMAEQAVLEARGGVERARSLEKGVRHRTVVGALEQEISWYCDLGDTVTRQARRRVLQGEQVPTEEKIYSIFEPHTDLIKRGKILKPIEFGHKVFLAESGRGLITQYRVLRGNPSDQVHVGASRERHAELFGQAPELYSSDRGFFSLTNLQACHSAGVKCACIPQAGGKLDSQRQALEKSPAFKKGQRFRAGIEGRISVLFRGRGMKRVLVQGRERFELLVGAAVLANNLMVIAALMRRASARGRRRAAA